MRLKASEIELLVPRVVERLLDRNLCVAKVDRKKLAQVAQALIEKNMQEEEALDREVDNMLDQYEAQIRSGQVDQHKMFGMIKKQLAKERNFVL